jgi:predicted transcriptional regulator
VKSLRRNDLDICADILDIARGGAKKTQLVYKANLNFKIIKTYLSRLNNNDLLTLENGCYVTTDRGVSFLQNYRELIAPFSKIRMVEY